MGIGDRLEQRKTAIKQRWLDLIIATYPPDSREFFKNQKNRFLNPVGAALHRQVEALYDVLLNEAPDEDIASILEDFVKVRAVQDFSPSQAIEFVLYLKQAIREELVEEIRSGQWFEELLALENRIDRLLLTAFDVYMQSREKIYQIRASDLKRQSFLALKRMDLDSARKGKVDDSQD